ncbi:hypothetical protein D3C72_1755220 [compost metagenome]
MLVGDHVDAGLVWHGIQARRQAVLDAEFTVELHRFQRGDPVRKAFLDHFAPGHTAIGHVHDALGRRRVQCILGHAAWLGGFCAGARIVLVAKAADQFPVGVVDRAIDDQIGQRR